MKFNSETTLCIFLAGVYLLHFSNCAWVIFTGHPLFYEQLKGWL